LRIPIYAVSKKGLYMVRPSDQKVIPVFSGTDWQGRDFQQDARNNKAIASGNYVLKVQLKDGKEVVLDSGAKTYPLELRKQLLAKGGEGFTAKDIKDVTAFEPGTLKPKK
jgi:hypothetical protein